MYKQHTVVLFLWKYCATEYKLQVQILMYGIYCNM